MRVKERIKKMKKFVGENISEFFSWYYSGDFPVSYTLEKCNNKEVIILCRQVGKAWRLHLKPSEFINNLNF